jgi:ABC-2 type transport system ATP-binding protein|tara:strand:- start:4858 stop:5802 length:945 start_codon:yes stop_codon:yes gene_type:complete
VSAAKFPISTENLVKRYDKYNEIGPISITLERKGIFGFLGPNGAGKTTTIRIILGLVRPNEGSVRIFGEDPFKNPVKALYKIGYAPELPSFQTFFSGEDVMNFTAKLYGINQSDKRRRVKELIEMVGLSDHVRKKVGKYSKGMVQRLSVAQALINDPELLILDEPTLGMDPAATIHFRDLFKTLSSEGKTILISSHQLDEVQRVATHIGMINRGRMVFQGTTASILEAFSKDFSIKIELEKINDDILDKIKKLSYVKEVKISTNGIQVILNEKKDLRADLADDIIKSGGRLKTLSLHNATLEDAFIETLRKENK